MINPMDPSSRGTKRRSSAQVRREMLSTATEMVRTHGLTVSLQHISLDSIAFSAGIPRSAVYRVWPNREDFFNELLYALGGSQSSNPAVFDGDTLDVALDTLKEELRENPNILATMAGRYAVLVEICRRGATVNYKNLKENNRWRTYLALAATAISYPEPVKTNLQSAIAQSEGDYLTALAEFYEAIGKVLGRRILPEFQSDSNSGRHPYAYLSATGAAAMEGLVIRGANFPKNADAGRSPELDIPARNTDPFGTGRKKEWNSAAVAFTSIFMTMTEAISDQEFPYKNDQIDGLISELEDRAHQLKKTEVGGLE